MVYTTAELAWSRNREHAVTVQEERPAEPPDAYSVCIPAVLVLVSFAVVLPIFVGRHVARFRRLGRPISVGLVLWDTPANVTLVNTLLPDTTYNRFFSSIGFAEDDCVITLFGIRRAVELKAVARRTGLGHKRSIEIKTPHEWLYVYPEDFDTTIKAFGVLGFDLD